MKLDNKSTGFDTMLIQHVFVVHFVVPGGSKEFDQLENKM